MQNKFFLVIILLALFSSQCIDKNAPYVTLKTKHGEINILNSGEYVLKYNNETVLLSNVDTFLWYNNEPYFALADGRIMRWDRVLSDHSYNLQKIWDKLYFIKQHGRGSEWEETSIQVIDHGGKIHETKIRRKNGESLNTENYGVFYDRYFVEEGVDGFCVTSSDGVVLACYPWPSEQNKEENPTRGLRK